MKYRVICSCGDVIMIKGRTREKAVRNMQALMTEATLYEHLSQKHIGEEVPSIEQVHFIIEQNLKPAA